MSPRIFLFAVSVLLGAVTTPAFAETSDHQQFVEHLQQLRQKKITPSLALADDSKPLRQRAAIAYLRQGDGAGDGKILEQFLPKAQGQLAVETMGALVERHQTSALPAIREKLATTTDAGVKNDALLSLGLLGAPEDVATLVKYLDENEHRGAAERALFTLSGKGVTAAFSKIIGDANAKASERRHLIGIATRRPWRQVVPVLIANLSDADEGIRNESLKALGRLAVKSDAEALKKARAKITDDAFGGRIDAAIQKLEK